MAAIGYKKNSYKSFRIECNCLPSCTSIEYDADVDRVKMESTVSKIHPNETFWTEYGKHIIERHALYECIMPHVY